MAYQLEYVATARFESAQAYRWYAQPSISMGMSYLEDIERTESFLKTNPFIYAKVEGNVHRAVLKRFPYSLFYTVEANIVTVLSCFHQNREPVSFIEL
jgi:toxin ParE1/3/4